jgi:hypothetical protein
MLIELATLVFKASSGRSDAGLQAHLSGSSDAPISMSYDTGMLRSLAAAIKGHLLLKHVTPQGRRTS